MKTATTHSYFMLVVIYFATKYSVNGMSSKTHYVHMTSNSA